MGEPIQGSVGDGMSGLEAWSLIAPILAKYASITPDGKPDKMSEAYVLTFGALKEHDERRRDGRSNQQTGGD